MARELTKKEIYGRMQELRNYRKLHAAQKVRIDLLEEQRTLLKEENALLRKENTTLKTLLQDVQLQLEEFKAKLFGKKRRHRDETKETPDDEPPSSASRTPDSYKRPLPTEDEVTETKQHPLDACMHCGHEVEKTEVTYFEEDIPLPQTKVVIKHRVEKGCCASCRRWSTGAVLPAASVILGQNVKRYVTYLSVVCRQSYAQIQDLLKHTYAFDLSQGEIAKILEKEGNRLRPEYEQLKVSIRGEPSIHLDETSWHLLIGDGYRRYGWTMTGGVSGEAVFVLGKTRGKGNAEELMGDSKAVLVSDDYGAYRNLETPHQLCCAHIHRKLRDLARSSELAEAARERATHTYHTFAAIYADLETARTSNDPATQHQSLLKRLRTFALPKQDDCAKLARIKKQVAERPERYLTCLMHSSVAADNNAAERSLRHLVLKRKISFGSFSERTAETLAILLSVLMAYRKRGTLHTYLRGV
jgi:transposase